MDKIEKELETSGGQFLGLYLHNNEKLNCKFVSQSKHFFNLACKSGIRKVKKTSVAGLYKSGKLYLSPSCISVE